MSGNERQQPHAGYAKSCRLFGCGLDSCKTHVRAVISIEFGRAMRLRGAVGLDLAWAVESNSLPADGAML